jgi:hypothetical protein
MLTSRETRTNALSVHEQVLLDEMWFRHAPGRAASLADSRRVVQRARQRVDRAIGGDLVRAGLADSALLAVRRGLMQTGWVAIVFALLTAMSIDLWLSRLGVWPFAIPVSLAVMGGLFLWAARRVPFLSVRGAYIRQQWQGRLRDLREAAEAGRVPAADFERCLPVMVACGAGAAWAAAWERVAPGAASERLAVLRQYTSRL